jgi:hypothetical protein
MNPENQSRILAELREAVSAFLYPLKTNQTVDQKTFARLESVSTEVTRLCKSETHLSKDLLGEIYLTARSIQPEEAYVAESDRAILRSMREKLDQLFYLLIVSETPGERTPGVPRIL